MCSRVPIGWVLWETTKRFSPSSGKRCTRLLSGNGECGLYLCPRLNIAVLRCISNSPWQVNLVSWLQRQAMARLWPFSCPWYRGCSGWRKPLVKWSQTGSWLIWTGHWQWLSPPLVSWHTRFFRWPKTCALRRTAGHSFPQTPAVTSRPWDLTSDWH